MSKVTFQLLSINYSYARVPKDCMHRIEELDPDATNPYKTFLPVIRCHGRCADGSSVSLNVYGFTPYFYLKAGEGETAEDVKELVERVLHDPERDADPDEVSDLEGELDNARNQADSSRTSMTPEERKKAYDHIKDLRQQIWEAQRRAERSEKVHSVTRRISRSIKGYLSDEEGGKCSFFRVNLHRPKDVALARDALLLHRNGRRATYESNVDFCLRLLIDRKIMAVDWVSATNCMMHVAEDSEAGREPWCHAVDLSKHDEPKHAPVRILSFDIETTGLNPNTDSALMIASLCYDFGSDMKKDPARSVTVFSCKSLLAPGKTPKSEWLDKGREDAAEAEEDRRLAEENSKRDEVTRMSDKALEDAEKKRTTERAIYRSLLCQMEVRSFASESEMLLAWSRYVTSPDIDPDILTGYNILGFDIPFLFNRADALGIGDEFRRLHKNRRGDPAVLRAEVMESKAYGRRENFYATIEGRTQMDMLEVIRRDHKLRKYKLDYVAGLFLGIFKADVHYTEIVPMWNSNDPEQLLKLAIYNLKDVVLPLRLMIVQGKLLTLLETARVCGVSPQMILKRGQQIKVFTKLLHCVRDSDFLIPYIPVGKPDGKFDGAVVIDPVRAYYNKAIITLDFTGLYPSIIRRWNLCYTTRITKEQADKMNPGDYYVTPAGYFFVREHVRKGVLSVLLEDLGKQRNAAKAVMQAAEESGDKAVEEVMNFRQNALKIFANGTYGFTGATVGKLPELAISTSVTAYGRDGLMLTKSIVEGLFEASKNETAVGTPLNPFGNRVIYGDTDSVMIDTGIPLGDTEESLRAAVEQAIIIGKGLAAVVNKFFQKPMQVEFEKVFAPYLLVNKKRYAGRHFTKELRKQPDGSKALQLVEKITCKGVEAVRRDNCTAVAMSQERIVSILLMKRSVDMAIKFSEDFVKRLVRGAIDINSLVITKEYSKTAEEYKAKQPHTELIKRMNERRGPNDEPVRTGDRIPYVIIRHPNDPKAKLFEKAEDPEYVLRHPQECAIDHAYYLSNQLLDPWARILDLAIGREGFTQAMFASIQRTGSGAGIAGYMGATASGASATSTLRSALHESQPVIRPPQLAKKGEGRTLQCTGDKLGIMRYFGENAAKRVKADVVVEQQAPAPAPVIEPLNSIDADYDSDVDEIDNKSTSSVESRDFDDDDFLDNNLFTQ